MPPTDPLIYRFYELIMVNGPALRALIEEEFGDGIMSAIDFDMDITRKADPKSARKNSWRSFVGDNAHLRHCGRSSAVEGRISSARSSPLWRV